VLPRELGGLERGPGPGRLAGLGAAVSLSLARGWAAKTQAAFVMLPSSRPKAARWASRAASLVGLSVEFSWAAGESVIVPYLLALGVTPELAGVVFLFNPVLTLPLQPLLGAWSDSCASPLGRRRPFILSLALLGLAGLAMLLGSSYCAWDVGGGGGDEAAAAAAASSEGGGGAPPRGSTVAVALAFAGFAISDVAHDCLLSPGECDVTAMFTNCHSPTAY